MPRSPVPAIRQAAPALFGTLATGQPFDLRSLRPRSVLVEFHRGTW